MIKQTSKSVRILDLLEQAGEKGMRFTDIQRALWGMTHAEPFTREVRGYWCTNLLGGCEYHAGLLHFFAKKNRRDGLWRRNAVAHNGHPWTLVKKVRRRAW